MSRSSGLLYFLLLKQVRSFARVCFIFHHLLTPTREMIYYIRLLDYDVREYGLDELVLAPVYK